jgi:hypothetical protein
VSRFLVVAATIPAVPLVVLCSWSRVAEPHWLAPAYLALALGAGLSGSVGRRLARASVAVGLAAAVFTWIWVGTPIGPEWLGRRYVPRFDLANDLYAWEGALRILERDLADARTDGRTIAVVAPHWVMCAQIHAALGTGVPVGCESPGNDDFATWFPRNAWSTAQTLLYVTDDRFPGEPERAVPDRAFVSAERYHVYRGSRLVRTIRITRLERKAFARG